MDGQFNAIHGIDKIGISPDGKPILIEMSLNKNFGKNLTLDGVKCLPSGVQPIGRNLSPSILIKWTN